jgi:hypothetical protein
MALYDRKKLKRFLAELGGASGTTGFESRLVPYLIDQWLDEYCASHGPGEIVETRVDEFSYLFDIAPGRLIAAWGVSRGPNHAKRDAARMRGHPLSDGSNYHRGHAIPHSLGGPTDINLVPQLGSLNVGAFRRLERAAVATPGALYFTYWIYGPRDGQKPRFVEQGLLLPNGAPDIVRHAN